MAGALASDGLDAVLMRGGTSRGPVLLSGAIPADPVERDLLLVRMVGGELQQTDAVGGGGPTTSKVVLVHPVTGDPDGVAFDYAVGNVVVGHGSIDWAGTCGNMTAAVPLFAFERQMIGPMGNAPIRLRNLSTGGLIDTTLRLDADHAPGRQAVVTTAYLNPGGAVLGSALPTGQAVEPLEVDDRVYQASLVDVTHPYLFLLHEEVVRDGDARSVKTLALIERLRGAVCLRLGLVSAPEQAMAISPAVPRVVLLHAPGTAVGEVKTTMRITAVSMGMAIVSVPVTAAMCLAAACKMPGTLPFQLCTGAPGDDRLEVIGPTARLSAGSTLRRDGTVASTAVDRTTRSIMRGTIWPAF